MIYKKTKGSSSDIIMNNYNNFNLSLINFGCEASSADFSEKAVIREKHILHFVYEGKGYYNVNNVNYSLKKGSVFAIYPGSIVSYGNLSSEMPMKFSWIGFDSAEADEVLSDLNLSHDLPVIQCSKIEEIHELISDFTHANLEVNSFNMFSYIRFLYSVLEILKNSGNIENTKNNLSLPKNYVMDDIVSYIYKNYSNDLSVEEIAETFHISHSTLWRYFKDTMAISPNEYIMSVKISKAMQLLNGSIPIKDIAVAVGIPDVQYFSKVFKQKTGYSPSSLKKMIK